MAVLRSSNAPWSCFSLLPCGCRLSCEQNRQQHSSTVSPPVPLSPGAFFFFYIQFALTDTKMTQVTSLRVRTHSTYHKLSQQFHAADHIPAVDWLCLSFFLSAAHLNQHSRKTLQHVGESHNHTHGIAYSCWCLIWRCLTFQALQMQWWKLHKTKFLPRTITCTQHTKY